MRRETERCDGVGQPERFRYPRNPRNKQTRWETVCPVCGYLELSVSSNKRIRWHKKRTPQLSAAEIAQCEARYESQSPERRAGLRFFWDIVYDRAEIVR